MLSCVSHSSAMGTQARSSLPCATLAGIAKAARQRELQRSVACEAPRGDSTASGQRTASADEPDCNRLALPSRETSGTWPVRLAPFRRAA